MGLHLGALRKKRERLRSTHGTVVHLVEEKFWEPTVGLKPTGAPSQKVLASPTGFEPVLPA
jgi:hypothetical protein